MRQFVIGLAGVTVAGAAAVAVMVARAPLDGAGAAMLAGLREATGLRIEANGPTTISLFPTPHIRISAVSVAKGDAPPFAVARQLVGAPSGTALLMGRLELGEITLDGVEISLDRAPVNQLYAAIRKAPAGGGALPSLRLRDARLDLAGRTVERVEAGLAWKGGGEPLTVSGFGTVSGQPVEAVLTITDPGALSRGAGAPFRARFEGGGARVMFDGSATDDGGLKVVGDLNARAASLRETLRWLDLPAPRKTSPLRGFSLAGRATADRDGLSLAKAELDLEGGSFLGAGRLFVASGRPVIEATLDTDLLDLDPYVAGIAPALRQDGAWNPNPVSLKTVGAYDLDLRLSADEVRLGDLRLGETAATVAMAKGAFDLSIGEASAYGGAVGGRLSIERDDGGARIRIQAEATDVALGDALKRFVDRPALTGALTGDLALEGAGASIADVVATLKGHGDIRVAGGEMDGFSKSRTLALAGLRGPMSIDTAVAALRVEQGVAHLDDLSIVGSQATFALAGDARIADRQLRLEGTVKPADGAWTLPVRVEGSFSSPKIRPNISGKDPRAAERERPAYAGK